MSAGCTDKPHRHASSSVVAQGLALRHLEVLVEQRPHAHVGLVLIAELLRPLPILSQDGRRQGQALVQPARLGGLLGVPAALQKCTCLTCGHPTRRGFGL